VSRGYRIFHGFVAGFPDLSRFSVCTSVRVFMVFRIL
jgi:hypothetical protein